MKPQQTISCPAPIIIHIEKAKANTFDGYIGFTNDEQDKVVFSGYVDLILNNVLNSGEKLSLFWKSDGQEQRTFNLGAEIPYIFKSPFGIKANLNIFKQDSTFQNTRTALDLGYYFNYTTRAYIGYQSNESSDIQNANTISLSDFESTFYTIGFEYTNFKIDDFLFPEKTYFEIKFGTGKRESNIENTNQFFGVYHVLGGLISPMDGVGPSDLFIDSLVQRVATTPVKEIILALSAIGIFFVKRYEKKKD